MNRPWDTGDPDRNWAGYFIPGTDVLRNRVGAFDSDALRDAEVDLSEYRLLETRENADVVGPRSYDMHHLASIHRHLFQDVYVWPGEVRTVGLEKGGESFCTPDQMRRAMEHVAMYVAELDLLRAVPLAKLPGKVAYLYDLVNFAHPFREGNGRSTREFFDQLLAERGLGLAGDGTDLDELHTACHVARADSEIDSLTDLCARIIDTEPAYEFHI